VLQEPRLPTLFFMFAQAPSTGFELRGIGNRATVSHSSCASDGPGPLCTA
jgi:hypothetical protein